MINELKYLSFKKIKNIVKVYVSYFQMRIGMKYRFAKTFMPTFLSVEPAAFCNLHCPECPVGQQSIHRKNKLMDIELFRKVIDETKAHLVHLILYFQGEPFLNPALFEMIDYAHTANIYTTTSTNAQLLSESVAKKIVQSHLDHIIISMDGTTQEVYEKYRQGGSLEKVQNAVTFLQTQKQKFHTEKPFIEIQFIAFQHNEHQLKEIKKWGKSWGANKVSIKTAQIYNIQKKGNLVPKNKKYSRYIQKNGEWTLKKKIKNSCLRILNGAVINSDGEVLPCCFDKNGNHSFGNSINNPFSDIWNNNNAKKFRETIFSNRKSVEMCTNCSE